MIRIQRDALSMYILYKVIMTIAVIIIMMMIISLNHEKTDRKKREKWIKICGDTVCRSKTQVQSLYVVVVVVIIAIIIVVSFLPTSGLFGNRNNNNQCGIYSGNNDYATMYHTCTCTYGCIYVCFISLLWEMRMRQGWREGEEGAK